MNGGGFPMRFADLDGTPIDVYQQNTNMTDESSQPLPGDRSTRCSTTRSGRTATTAPSASTSTRTTRRPAPATRRSSPSAQARGVPVISYKQLLDWIDGRNDSTIRGLSWSAGTLTFTTTVAAGANGLADDAADAGPVRHA